METIDEKKYTVEEYLSLVEAEEYKLEYYYGDVIAMAGAKPNHSIISSNLITVLATKLTDDSDFVLLSGRQAVAIGNKSVLYPDVIISPLPLQLDHSKTLLLNPTIIVEIKSRRPRSIQLSRKFDLYREIPSLQEYLLLDSECIGFQSFFKEEGDLWRISSGRSIDQTIPLYSLDLEIPLERIYKKILPFEDAQ